MSILRALWKVCQKLDQLYVFKCLKLSKSSCLFLNLVITISGSEETKDSDFPTDYSSETDDKSIVINFVKTMNKSLLLFHLNRFLVKIQHQNLLKFLDPCDSDKSKNKRRRRKRTAFTKKKNLRKSSNPSKIQQNPESSATEHQYLQIHKLITLALFLRYADAKNTINESKTE